MLVRGSEHRLVAHWTRVAVAARRGQGRVAHRTRPARSCHAHVDVELFGELVDDHHLALTLVVPRRGESARCGQLKLFCNNYSIHSHNHLPTLLGLHRHIHRLVVDIR